MCTSNASLGGMYWKGHGYHLQSMRLQYVKTRGGGCPITSRFTNCQKRRKQGMKEMCITLEISN